MTDTTPGQESILDEQQRERDAQAEGELATGILQEDDTFGAVAVTVAYGTVTWEVAGTFFWATRHSYMLDRRVHEAFGSLGKGFASEQHRSKLWTRESAQ